MWFGQLVANAQSAPTALECRFSNAISKFIETLSSFQGHICLSALLMIWNIVLNVELLSSNKRRLELINNYVNCGFYYLLFQGKSYSSIMYEFGKVIWYITSFVCCRRTKNHWNSFLWQAFNYDSSMAPFVQCFSFILGHFPNVLRYYDSNYSAWFVEMTIQIQSKLNCSAELA